MTRRFPLVLLALLGAAPLAAQSIPASTGGQLSSLPGLAFDVPIIVDMRARPEMLGAFAARLTWNPARLRLDASTAGSFGSVTASNDSLAQGIARLAGANPAGAAGLVTLGSLRFTPLIADTAIIGLSFPELFAAGSFADLSGSLSVSSGQFCPALGRFGDLDRDGASGSRDALIALSAAVGIDITPNDESMGDVDASGAVNARDALGILTYAVGLPTSGFRVLALALGPCATGGPITLQIAPGVADSIIVGQTIRFEARASDGAGALQAIPDAIWSSSDDNVLTVGPNGVATARGAGTVVLKARRAGQDSASLQLVVVAQRSRHVVDASALQSTNQLGTAALPFGRLVDALFTAADGDTISIRPGTYEPALIAHAMPRLTIIGDTTPAGARPVIRGSGPSTGGVGLSFLGTQAIEVRDVAFDGLSVAIMLQGSGRVTLAGLRAQAVGSLVMSNGPVQHLRLLRSRAVGDVQVSADAIGLFGPADTVVIEDSDLSDFGGYGISGDDVDSISVRRSQLHDMDGIIEASWLDARARGMAIAIDSSQLRRTNDAMIDVYNPRSVVIRWSVLSTGEANLIEINSDSSTGYLRLHRDSLFNEDDDWLDADGLDSIVVDSVTADLQWSYGYIYNVGAFRVRNSRFDGPYYFVEAGLGESSTQRPNTVIDVRGTTVTGPADCDRCGYAIEADDDDISVAVDSSTFINLDYAIEVYGDSSLTVTRSTFRHVYYAIEFEGNYSVGCAECGSATTTATVTGSVFEDVEYGIEVYDALAVVDSNRFTNTYQAIEIATHGSAQVTRNLIQQAEYGVDIELDDSSATLNVSDNVLEQISSYGIELDADGYADTLAQRADVRRNVIGCTGEAGGGEYSYGHAIYTYDMHATIADNQIASCNYSIEVYYYGSTPRQDSVLRNRIQLPTQSNSGIRIEGTLRSHVRGNHLSGDSTAGQSYGMIRVDGYDTGSQALIERDTILGGARYGVAITYLDTVTVRDNIIEDVRTQYDEGALHVEGYFNADTVRLLGNAVRRARGDGVSILNYGTAVVLLDSNLVSQSGDQGVHFRGGPPLRMRRNTVAGSLGHGIYFSGYGNGAVLDSNNIEGNVPFGLYDGVDGGIDAANNWWGDASGPSCSSACPGGTGDSISTAITWTPWLTAPHSGAPPITAPPALVRSTGVLARLPALRAPSATTARAPHGSRTAVQRARPAGAEPADPARARQRAERSQRRDAARAAREQEKQAEVTRRAQQRAAMPARGRP